MSVLAWARTTYHSPSSTISDRSVFFVSDRSDRSDSNTTFSETCVFKEHDVLLDEGEWIFADTAYPLHSWCQAPYKK
ncbi:uncharacterized protein EDB91DRAFT_1042455 [Suillus paluster]|uniref:uncharacterized protein n=1 Tax=Suillus paluster TaxID=48578 RepID=UPI001B87ED2A|nr:uncharacterized protein EDB91DRAFT_1042455 [Suillus paluster]KAG1754721.1 hypothetical protein EDB91DRAFT_1042455 [Suillus paluster]